MTQKQIEIDWAIDSDASVDKCLSIIANKIDWLNRVEEWEYSLEDKARILIACARFYRVIHPMAVKYIDGDNN